MGLALKQKAHEIDYCSEEEYTRHNVWCSISTNNHFVESSLMPFCHGRSVESTCIPSFDEITIDTKYLCESILSPNAASVHVDSDEIVTNTINESEYKCIINANSQRRFDHSSRINCNWMILNKQQTEQFIKMERLECHAYDNVLCAKDWSIDKNYTFCNQDSQYTLFLMISV